MRLLLALVMVLYSTHSMAAGMVASTHPLFLIAKAVTQDIEQPELLLLPSQTGHDVQLRPQDKQRLTQANLVLWFGASYEAPLAKLLTNKPNAIALFELDAFKRLPLRNTRGEAQAQTLDPHIWLDPINAIAIAHAIAAVRAKQYPQHAKRYQDNAAHFGEQMVAAIREQSASTQPAAYWAYHDAYQYLEQSVGLDFKGSLTSSHDLPPTASQLMWLSRQRPSEQQEMCLLAEVSIDPATVKKLQPVKLQAIDEVMLGQTDFVQAWRQLAAQVRLCTAKSS